MAEQNPLDRHKTLRRANDIGAALLVILGLTLVATATIAVHHALFG